MRVEITHPLELDPQQQAQLDLHSFLNVLNVLTGNFVLFHDTVGAEPFAATTEQCYAVSEAFQKDPSISGLLSQFYKLRQQLGLDLDVFRQSSTALDSDGREQWENIVSIVAVLDIRYQEMKARQTASDAWLKFDMVQLRNEFEAYLGVVEKNSLGRYHIVTNVASKDPKEYLVQLNFAAFEGQQCWLPGVLKDVTRDLLSNARKYTEPGGTIEVSLIENETSICLVVKDTGRGIPEDQLGKVVDFGFRGSNVADKETKGGGFGLTKAYHVSREFHGKMWIESSPGHGTAITIEIPRKGSQ